MRGVVLGVRDREAGLVTDANGTSRYGGQGRSVFNEECIRNSLAEWVTREPRRWGQRAPSAVGGWG